MEAKHKQQMKYQNCTLYPGAQKTHPVIMNVTSNYETFSTHRQWVEATESPNGGCASARGNNMGQWTILMAELEVIFLAHYVLHVLPSSLMFTETGMEIVHCGRQQE